MDILDLCSAKEADCNCKQVLNGHNNGQAVSNRNLREQLAQAKIFTSIMLNAWRQRRSDVRLLKQRVESLQKNTIKFKNELHVSRTLMRVEQKRCKELQLELTKSTLSIKHVRKSYDELSSSLHSLQTEKEQLEQQLNSFRAQQTNKHNVSGKCSEELHKALLEQRETSKKLSEQLNHVRRLKSDQDRLLKKMFEMENEHRKRKESYVQQLEQKDRELRYMRLRNESLESLLQDRQKYHSDVIANRITHSMNSRQRYEFKPNVKNMEWTENTQSKSSSSDTQLTQRTERKGIRQFLSSIQHYTSAAFLLLWIVFLPRKSQRYGCTP